MSKLLWSDRRYLLSKPAPTEDDLRKITKQILDNRKTVNPSDRQRLEMERTGVIQEFTNLRLRVHGMYDPQGFYATKYYPEEPGYWGQIPQWMKEEIYTGDRALDIGPGYGGLAAWAKWLGCVTVTTCDRIAYLSDGVRDAFKLATITGVDIERQGALIVFKSPLDHVIMTEVLEHFNFNPLRTLKIIRSMLMPSGKLYLSTPIAGQGWPRMDKPQGIQLGHWRNPLEVTSFDPATMDYNNPEWFDGHVWHYTEAEVNDLLTRSGFRVLKTGTSRSSGGSHQQVLACVAL